MAGHAADARAEVCFGEKARIGGVGVDVGAVGGVHLGVHLLDGFLAPEQGTAVPEIQTVFGGDFLELSRLRLGVNVVVEVVVAVLALDVFVEGVFLRDLLGGGDACLNGVGGVVRFGTLGCGLHHLLEALVVVIIDGAAAVGIVHIGGADVVGRREEDRGLVGEVGAGLAPAAPLGPGGLGIFDLLGDLVQLLRRGLGLADGDQGRAVRDGGLLDQDGPGAEKAGGVSADREEARNHGGEQADTDDFMHIACFHVLYLRLGRRVFFRFPEDLLPEPGLVGLG